MPYATSFIIRFLYVLLISILLGSNFELPADSVWQSTHARGIHPSAAQSARQRMRCERAESFGAKITKKINRLCTEHSCRVFACFYLVSFTSADLRALTRHIASLEGESATRKTVLLIKSQDIRRRTSRVVIQKLKTNYYSTRTSRRELESARKSVLFGKSTDRYRSMRCA